MDCLSPILELGTRLWDCSSKHLAYIHHLEENLQNLRVEIDKLKGRIEDVRHIVEAAEQQPRMRRREVDLWLKSAANVHNEVSEIVESGREELQNKCVGNWCPKNLKSTYKIGKRLIQKIDSVQGLLDEAAKRYNSESDVVVKQKISSSTRLLMLEWPLGHTVGLDAKVEEVWKAIEDENVRIIKLSGQGAVGKTTLLKKICNEFRRRSHDFDAVIWAEIPSEQGYIEKVQESIRKQLVISDDIWNQYSG